MNLSLVSRKPRLILSLVFLTGCLTLFGVSARLSKFLPLPTSLHCLVKTAKMIHDRFDSAVLSQQEDDADDAEFVLAAEGDSEITVPSEPIEPELESFTRRHLSSHHFKRPPPVRS